MTMTLGAPQLSLVMLLTVGTGPEPAPVPDSHPRVATAMPWGSHGHEIAARAAATELPPSMPAFFRGAAAQLEYLNPEPDRWRSRELRYMDEAYKYDHYIDLENVPEGALDARDRYEFIRHLYAAGLERPEQAAGFLPFHILELYQRLVQEFALWRNAPGPRERGWIETRIVADAGVLGHYVTDGAQPHHTTIHFNGWSQGAPNPQGYTEDRTFHGRFEADFVNAHVGFADLLPHIETEPRRLEDVRTAVFDFLLETHGQVERLYQLDRDVGFSPGLVRPETKEFTLRRLAAGAEMLRALWWTAWLESESIEWG